MKKILQLKGRAMINFLDVNGNTCLHIAAMNSNLFLLSQDHD